MVVTTWERSTRSLVGAIQSGRLNRLEMEAVAARSAPLRGTLLAAASYSPPMSRLAGGRQLVRTARSRVGRRLQDARFDRVLAPRPRDDIELFGSVHACYAVPLGLVGPESVVYSCGIGENTSFDLALIAATGCSVHAFDPTPRARAHAEATAARDARFHFHPYGVWSSDGVQRFYAPSNPAHVSHSIGSPQQTEHYLDADCRTLESLMRELGHDHIDLLKLDVEGAELAIMPLVAAGRPAVGVLCVEFHPDGGWERARCAAAELTAAGYEPVSSRRMTATFIRSSDG